MISKSLSAGELIEKRLTTGEWIERIGWPRFFKLTGIPFTRYHLDDFKNAGQTYARSAHIKF